MPTKFERDRDEARLARHQRVAQQIKDTDRQMSRDTSRTLLLYTGDIVPDPDQPRRLYDDDEAALEALAGSIREVGLLSPIQVRPHPEDPGRYLIIVGERRWRACRMAGVNRIEAVVREDWDDFQVRAAQFEENEKRQDVSDMARARSLAGMRDAGAGRRRGWDEIAQRVGLQRNQVMRLVGLMQLPPEAQEMIDRRRLPGTHGFELARLRGRVPDEEIVRLARASCASAPGGKAGQPVKDLSRQITERLQAAYEAAQGADGATQSADGASPGTDGATPTQEPPPPFGDPPGAGPKAEGGRAGGTEPPVSGQTPVGGERSGEDAPPSTGAEPGDPPRSFVLEVIRAWKEGELRDSERRMLREALAEPPPAEKA